MTPANFAESNIEFVAPPDLDEEQCRTIGGYQGVIKGGSLDGSPVCVVAWRPSESELELLKAGQPMFLTFIGGIPPHYPSMSFQEATHPA